MPALKHSFFFNIDTAIIEAKKQNTITDENGQEQLQHCYYDGPFTNIIWPNLIKVDHNNIIDFFSNNKLPIPTQFVQLDNNIEGYELYSQNIINTIQENRNKLSIANYVHQDSYFINSLEALNTAKQQNRVNCGNPVIDGLQICYYDGEVIDTPYQNLIHLNFSNFIDFFIYSRLRIPIDLVCPKDASHKIKQESSKHFKKNIQSIEQQREKITTKLKLQAKKLKPDFSEKHLRVWLPASRYTTVLQYAYKAIAREFEYQGYKIHLDIEVNEMEGINRVDFMKIFIAFKPHIAVYINHKHNEYLHDDVINFIWWQDPMPILKQREHIKWRENDHVFVYSELIQKMMIACGKNDFIDQPPCIDENIFYPDTEIKRENSIVFLGSSYYSQIQDFSENEHAALEQFMNLFVQGISLIKQRIEIILNKYQVTIERLIYGITYIVRDTSVKWLCSQNVIPFQLYGNGWDYKAIFNKNHKGQVSHGTAVADIYRKARYALVCLPHEVESQRLAEIIACGCIPIVFDSRDYCNYSDDLGLNFYKTQADIIALLEQPKQLKRAKQLPTKFTYKNLIKQYHYIITKSIKKEQI
ncbi:MAG: hypothetical protein KZQ83_19570 [gamma proteobacterium symbiont of Taylorina sp.]|nr:hypothetical protein [gamma proteobacterium symbiont of Taylorina sp.]